MKVAAEDGRRTAGISPLLKWAGGKRAFASEIVPLLAFANGRYFEPFAGGAAIFFSLVPAVATLADLNADLIECYSQLRSDPAAIHGRLQAMENSEAAYYSVRSSNPVEGADRAARFIYLTSLSFNGLYRQNRKGAFNVPYGHKYQHKLPSLEKLEAVSNALKEVRLLSGDFQTTTADAVAGDTLYFDPPYTVAHNNNGFIKYNADIFSWGDQKRLAILAARLAAKGCRVVVSNANHDAVRELYPGFECLELHRMSLIAARGKHRRAVSEVLFVSR